MKTPAGFECQHFHGDYFRGRHVEECRLIARHPHSEPWTPGLCRDCPVPKIERANACPHLMVEAQVVKTWLGLGRKVVASAVCRKSGGAVDNLIVGCGQCHDLKVFEDALENG